MAQTFKDSLDVWKYVCDKMVKLKFGGQEQYFLPRTAFNIVTAPDVIKLLLTEDEDVYTESDEESDQLITSIQRDGRKFFAICVFCDIPMTLVKALLGRGLTDARVPLTDDDYPQGKLKKKFVSGFLRNQRSFNTPYFKEDSTLSLDDRVMMPIAFEESVDSFLGKGAFGEVWKIWIHKDHRSFSSMANPDGYFAMKITSQSSQKTREENFHREMAAASLKHDHLVKCLTSFTFGSRYHMVYELANCNLEELMKNHADVHMRNPEMTSSWLARQLCGLARALQIIHDQGEPQAPAEPDKLHVKEDKPGRSGYIHDIKPENILVFVYKGTLHWLRLSDFSCAKVVDLVATISGNNRQSYQTESKTGTPIYRAPESWNGKTSRPYDLWSLGCVYLELLVWYMDGFEALEAFRTSRERQVRPGGITDEGFYYSSEDCENAEVRLREPVVKKLEELSRRCEGDLKDIADVIPSLLKINPKDRPKIGQLVERLEHLDSTPDLEAVKKDFESVTGPQVSVPPNLPLRHEIDSDDFGGFVKVSRPTE